jgi:N-acetylglucosamine-6-phosphate deacetylase
MTILSGADVVLPGRVMTSGTVVLDGDRITEVLDGVRAGGEDVAGQFLLPGFIDVHVHGLHGLDALDEGDPIEAIARLLPRFGVTAFCPTSVACPPRDLERMLRAVRRARSQPPKGSRVLPAHLESNFINPDYKGAQPASCLRSPRERVREGDFSGQDILNVIAAARAEVGILTIAPELDGALELIADLVRHGHRVSLGHSGASFEEAVAGVEAGATQATHLFNRMTPLGHRAPGLAGAVLAHEGVAAELICDGVHVHPAMMRMALAAKHPERVMAITDGTAGAGLPFGAEAMLAGRRIRVGDAAYLDDGTIAGSVLTMDQAFGVLVQRLGVPLPEAAMVCATTPARELGLGGCGVIAAGAVADVIVMDRSFRVVRTYIGGSLAFDARTAGTPDCGASSIPRP